MKLARMLSGTVAACLLFHPNVNADIIFVEDFEDSDITYLSASTDALSDVSNKDYFGRLSTGQLPPTVYYQNYQGTGFYGVQDTDSAQPLAVDDVVLTWQNIDISQWQNLSLSWFIAEADAGDGNEDLDANTEFSIDTQINKSGYNPLFSVRSAGGTNNQARVDTNFDGIGDGATISNAFTQYTRELLLGSVLDIQVTFANFDAGDEDFAFDQLMLTGERKAINTVPEPASLVMMLIALLLLFCKDIIIRQRFFRLN